MDRFAAGEGDAVAGVRASLLARFAEDTQAVILAEALASVGQAMAVPVALAAALPALDAFLVRAKVDGFIASAIDAGGAKGLTVPA